MTAPAPARSARSLVGGRDLTWLWIALGLAVLAGILLLLLPLSTSAGAQADEVRQSLLDREGWGAVAVLAIPVALCGAPLLAPRGRRRTVTMGAAVLLAAGVLIGSASIGLFYLPALVSTAFAASRMRQPALGTESPPATETER